jgi:hypothetical protein
MLRIAYVKDPEAYLYTNVNDVGHVVANHGGHGLCKTMIYKLPKKTKQKTNTNLTNN